MSKFDYAVIMPKMSMTMEEGELLGIRVKVGDVVKSGDVLLMLQLTRLIWKLNLHLTE